VTSDCGTNLARHHLEDGSGEHAAERRHGRRRSCSRLGRDGISMEFGCRKFCGVNPASS
jgi:hypothetical protein